MRDRKQIRNWNTKSLLSLMKNMMGVKVTKKELANMTKEDFFKHQVKTGRLKAMPNSGTCMFCGKEFDLFDEVKSSCVDCRLEIFSDE